MSTRFSLATGVLVASLVAVADARAQMKAFSGSSERQSTGVFLYTESEDSFQMHGMVSVHYGAPEWKEDYAGMVAKTKPGTRARLGKDLWTTLDTNVPLKAGDATIAAGTHYLAVEMGEGGKISLVVLDAAKVHAKKWHPGMSGESEGGTKIPMEMKSDLPVETTLAIELKTGDDPRNLALIVRWGPYEARAKLRADVEA